MTIANVSRGSAQGLPSALRTAQSAISLPEVQEMLRKLAEHNLGIFMPHMHDEETGHFQSLPNESIQVESGLEVSFRPTEEIVRQANRFLPVGWLWRAGVPAPVAVCKMVWEEGRGETERNAKHDMKRMSPDSSPLAPPRQQG